MGTMKRFVLVLLGLVAAMLLLDALMSAFDEGGVLGLFVGAGALAFVYFQLRRRLRLLEASFDRQLQQLKARIDALSPESVNRPEAVKDAAVDKLAGNVVPGVVEPAPVETPAALVAVAAAAPSEAPAMPSQAEMPVLAVEGALEVDERSRGVTTSIAASVAAWFHGGNTIVRLAVLILLLGIVFLLRYAVEHQMLPIEIRLAAVAVGGIALVLVGWRLRRQRRGYSLTLQGAGLGVLYMTMFAAMRMYALVPPALGFALLVALAAAGALLALLQDALPLAVVGLAGGLAAPLLSATEPGSHVLLFGYYLVLNVAIAVIAGYKAWKLLNLVGFAATSLIGAVWGASAWHPDLLASTEPFLVAHFLLYLYISVQYSRQASRPFTDRPTAPYVDAVLVFGSPLAAMGLQAGMVHHIPYALAVSAAVLSGIYLLLGRWLWRRGGEQLRLLTEGMLVLGTVFMALVAPLAVDARWTAAAWAVQGGGLVWLGLRQGRSWALWFGIALQPLATLAYWAGRPDASRTEYFIANANFTGVVLLVASAWVAARLLRGSAERPRPSESANATGPRILRPLQIAHWGLLLLGLLNLLGGGFQELQRAPWSTPDLMQSSILFATLVAVALELGHRRLGWAELAVPARPLIGLAGLLSLVLAAESVAEDRAWQRLWPGGAAEAVALVAVGLWLLRRLDATAPRSVEPARGFRTAEALAWAWYTMLQSSLFVYAAASYFVVRHQGWSHTAVIVAPTLLAWGVLEGLARGRWPMSRDPFAWLAGLASPWMVVLVAWSWIINLTGDGSMRPLPYVPLLNPVDLGHGLLLLYALRLAAALASQAHFPFVQRWRSNAQPIVAAAAAAVVFWWASSLLVRTLHHWAASPMWLDGALQSGLVQMALSILWTLIALAAMYVATRRVLPVPARPVWMAGAVLLGIVVVKLLLVDLSQTSALQRIVSFVGVGLLMLLVGYVAPLPPQDLRQREGSPHG